MRRNFKARVTTTVKIKCPDKADAAIAARHMSKALPDSRVHVRRNLAVMKLYGLVKPSRIFGQLKDKEDET